MNFFLSDITKTIDAYKSERFTIVGSNLIRIKSATSNNFRIQLDDSSITNGDVGDVIEISGGETASYLTIYNDSASSNTIEFVYGFNAIVGADSGAILSDILVSSLLGSKDLGTGRNPDSFSDYQADCTSAVSLGSAPTNKQRVIDGLITASDACGVSLFSDSIENSNESIRLEFTSAGTQPITLRGEPRGASGEVLKLKSTAGVTLTYTILTVDAADE